MKILIVTEAWKQTNGVSTCYKNIVPILRENGYEITVIYPELFDTFKIPFYPEVEMPYKIRQVWSKLQNTKFDHIHIATEGLLGLIARLYCSKYKIPFTTAYHTNISDYLYKMLRLPKIISWRYLKWFHSKAKKTLVTTKSMKNDLIKFGFKEDNMTVWTRGVDRSIFKFLGSIKKEKSVLGYVGRVSVEKGLDDFLSMKTPEKYKKVIVGDGPYLTELKKKYPDVTFTGYKFGNELAEIINEFDVFVFPSRTDTFGIVLIEAITCGVPVAAYPVTGPIDIIVEGKTGALDNDLSKAVNRAIKIKSKTVLNETNEWTWHRCADIFLKNI